MAGGPRRVAIVGAGELGQSLAEVMASHRWMGFEPVCFVDDDLEPDTTHVSGIPVEGTSQELPQLVDSLELSEVFVCLPQRDVQKTTQVFDALINTHAVVKYVPDIFSFSLMSARMSNVGGIPVVSVYDSPLSGKGARLAKLLMDKSLASLILLLISPLMLAIAVGVKLSSPRPRVLPSDARWYQQSIVRDAQVPLHARRYRQAGPEVGGMPRRKRPPVLARCCARAASMNSPSSSTCLRGEMSIVGPRPERDVFVEQFRHEIPRYMQKHMVKAGITGLAQVNGYRGDTCLHKRIEHDLRYISDWSLWLDTKIILRTVGKVFKDASAK